MKKVLLVYLDQSVAFDVPDRYPELNLQKNWLAYRFNNPALKTDDETEIRFIPTGADKLHGGQTLPVWEGRDRPAIK